MSLLILASLLLLAVSMHTQAYMQTQESANASAYDCTQVSLNDIDPALLTKEERVALLDDSLSKSIDSYSTCVASVAQSMAGSNSGEAGGNGGGDLEGSADAEGEEQRSNANPKPTNNGSSENQSQSEGVESQPQQPIINLPPSKQSAAATRGIIPPKDNDKIICKLLFQEIAKTQNPDMLKGLKEQYSNYKCG